MQQFSDLYVWKDNQVKSRMQWYVKVAKNFKPAKFLIARRVACEIGLKGTEEDLWQEHSRLTKIFLQTWTAIKNNQAKLSDYTLPDVSLLDLNEELVYRMLKHCNFCRWNCKIDRSIVDREPNAKTGTCQLGQETRVSSYFHHRGEELVYRGTHGSGTIFFSSCNLRCGFCQNGDISKDKDNGTITSPNDLAKIALILRLEGVHNINFVGGDPIVHLHTIVSSINNLKFQDIDESEVRKLFLTKSDRFINYPMNKKWAEYEGEFNVPLLWNSNFFMTHEAIRILRTIIDVWLPDFKFGNKKCAQRLARTPWYFETVSEMHKKIYDWGEDFSIRHLIMPNHVECCSKPIFDWIAKEIPDAPINVMDQYHPDSYANPTSNDYNPRLEDISIYPSKEEVHETYRYAESLGLKYETITFEKDRRKRY